MMIGESSWKRASDTVRFKEDYSGGLMKYWNGRFFSLGIQWPFYRN